MENDDMFKVNEQYFYAYLKRHPDLIRKSDGGMGEEYNNENGYKVAWRFHGFACSEYYIAGEPNQETTVVVQCIMNRY